MFRIRSDEVVQQKGAPAVLLQHGLFASSDCWIMNYNSEAPAYYFAKHGYDVWLGNNRGNKFSRKHIKLNPDEDSEKFFDYSF
jgi:pimeloyl-ACP methyl ester carboxylesterase